MLRRGQQDELLREVSWLRQRVAELEADRARGLRLDSVTGLLSARAFRGRLSEEVDRARRYQRPLSLVVVSIDDFTALELRHGFRAGDELLMAVAKRLGGSTRSHDLVGRTGQAEFGLLLPDTSSQGALPSLERLLVELEVVGEGIIRAAGASMGVAMLERGMTAEGFLAAARLACQRAQACGGGRAVMAAESGGEREGEPAGAQREAIEALAVALLERDRYTGEHSEAVIEMSGAVARNLGLNSVEVERVKSAALLHDIGKVAIPDDILLKPARLTPEEFELVKDHTAAGADILDGSRSAVLRLASEIALSHHEWWDGSGYPRGLSGTEIPLSGRIVAVADVFDALTHVRPYKRAWPVVDALAEVRRLAGRQFDPAVVEAFLTLDHAELVERAEPGGPSEARMRARASAVGRERRAAGPRRAR